jgi:hypothetical protein
MFTERLKEAKEDHDSLHAKLDACIDGIKSISTGLASSHTGEKEQNKKLGKIQDNTNCVCEHIPRKCKEK